jgi:hypothetical protein
LNSTAIVGQDLGRAGASDLFQTLNTPQSQNDEQLLAHITHQWQLFESHRSRLRQQDARDTCWTFAQRFGWSFGLAAILPGFLFPVHLWIKQARRDAAPLHQRPERRGALCSWTTLRAATEFERK